MFNNVFANKRCIRSGICYRRKMQSCEFSLTMILFILLHAFLLLIGFLKKIAQHGSYQQKTAGKLLLVIFVMQLLISYLVISDIDAS